MVIDTRRLDLRPLRFATLDEALAEARRLVEHERAGRLERRGNWSTGKLLGHLAWWIDAAFDGWGVKPPLLLRLLGPLMKKSVVSSTAKPGLRVLGAPEGTYGLEELSTDEGLARFERAVERLKHHTPTAPNPVFGRMTRDQWIGLHLRHAENHLRFLVPVER